MPITIKGVTIPTKAEAIAKAEERMTHPPTISLEQFIVALEHYSGYTLDPWQRDMMKNCAANPQAWVKRFESIRHMKLWDDELE